MSEKTQDIEGYEILIKGLVQGVGFRPFICRLAAKHGLSGEVGNRTDGVSVILQGDLKTIDLFSNEIIKNAPPASNIKSIEIKRKSLAGYDSFRISNSRNVDDMITEISPDIAVCEDCLNDLKTDPERIDYPFINCTNCGPRFSIIKALPYDRPMTTMKGFRMCNECKSEYENIFDRRYHAQPIACNKCGPVLSFKDGIKTSCDLNRILEEVSLRISSGETVAVKGLGGYFLMCDALNNDAVKELRWKKHRDEKPFAVMFRDIEAVRSFCYLDTDEEKELISWRRPILILKQKKKLAPTVSNSLNTTGAMLPYMPLHYLLFKNIRTPAVVLTSGNISDDPIIIDDSSAETHLMPVAGSILSYDRDIFNRTDDSVIRVIDHNPSLYRRSRGYVPRPVDLKFNAEGILALGAEQKNTFCMGKGCQAIMSQHIGDLKTPAVYDFLRESVDRFTGLFNFRPAIVACDLHPDYLSSQYAEMLEKEGGIQLSRVQHHHAHIASCLAEHGIEGEVIGVSFDGTGFGTDGNIWGSEFMIASLGKFDRITHFDYVPMPGGDKAITEPWRMAFSYLFRYFGDRLNYKSIPLFRTIDDNKLSLVREMIIKEINSPLSSGAGRLFDAFSAILGLCSSETFDSEAPMRLESAIDCITNDYYPFKSMGTLCFSDTFTALIEDMPKHSTGLIAARLHNTVAQSILETTLKISNDYSLNRVVLSGGVFQNKYLLEKTLALLRSKKFEVLTNHLVPANDGGVSLGQLAVTSKLRR